MRDALDLYDLPFYNNSGEAIPPYAVMQVDNWKDDANNRDYFRVRKPNGSGKMFIVNGPLEVAIAGDGMGSRKEGIPARYLSGTPAPDEEWGPTSGSWYLSASGSGFNVVGGNETLNGATVTHVNLAGASSGNIIYAQVVSNVADSDPTFTFDNAVALVGSAPTGGTGTAQNQYAQEYLDNEWVILSQRKDNGQWLTERGGTSGSQVVYFEITEHKVYGDNAVLAKPVLADGTMDAGADEFYVVDEKNLFYGRAAEDSEDGYRGFALRYTDDYSEGVPGFRIIDMQGPAHWLIVTLTETASSTTTCSIGSDQIWGRPSRGQRLPPSGNVEVYDDLSVASGAQSGDKWLAAWDEADEHYIFIVPISDVTPPMIPAIAMITVDCPAMDDANLDGSAKTAMPGVSSDTAATILKWKGNLPPELEEDSNYDPMAVLNLTETELTASTSKAILKVGYIQKFHDPDAETEEEETVYMFVFAGPRDIRELGGFDKPTKQIPYHDEDSANEILDGEDCPEE